MPHISTLIADMQATLSRPNWLTPELSEEVGHETAIRLLGQFKERTAAPTLRLSQMGPRCPKALWASIHAPTEAEDLPPSARFKFAFGHQIEALIIALAKASGHSVTGEQDELVLDGIKGHRDCVIDGCVVDVKSASSLSYKKFASGAIRHSDSFGYLEQLDGYVVASADDPLVSCKDRGYLLAVDKQLGHFCLYEHIVRPQHIRNQIGWAKAVVKQESPPDCACPTAEDGKGGNMRLSFPATYSPYKHYCFPHLRTFLYKDGDSVKPVHFTRCVKRPMPHIMEVDRRGHIVYN